VRRLEVTVSEGIETLQWQAAKLADLATAARETGDEAEAEKLFGRAFGLALDGLNRTADYPSSPGRLKLLGVAVRLALECGEVVQARRLINEAISEHSSNADREEWEQLAEINTWSDAWLIAAVRRDPPDEPALDVLVARYWKLLFSRCHMLTLEHEKANDLAQEAWCRVLRARRQLKPGGNFPAYLATVATNLWRDSRRSARRAGPLAEQRIASTDAPVSSDEDETVVLGDLLPDLSSLEAEKQTLLAMDIDAALERLTPRLREVLVARFINGESCAEIGRRYRRTEQSISGWVREAIREMKSYLEQSDQRSELKQEA